MHYQQQHPHHPPGCHQFPREPAGSLHFNGAMGPQNASPYLQRSRDYAPPPPYGYGDIPANYSNESRNYTDSQLGVGGSASTSHGNMTQLASPSPAPPPNYRPSPLPAPPPNYRPSSLPAPPPNYRPSPQPLQQYSTQRMPRHATVLKDRGSAENSDSVGSDPSGGSDSMGYGYGGRGSSKMSPPSMKGNHRAGSHGKNLNRAGKASAKSQPKEMRSPDGRHTPVRDRILEGQVLFATPNQRREVPSTPTSYSEPPRNRTGNRAHQNMSPNYNRMRSPDHHAGNYSKGGGGGGYYNKNQLNNKHQSKLPHGLTVQELKEMTRARLAAESEIGGPEGSSDQSVHSVGTQSSSKGSDQFSLGRGSNLALSNESMTRNLVQSNESIRRDYSNQGLNSQSFAQGQQQQLQQMQQQQNPPQYSYPRHPSPVFEPGPPPNQFNGNQPIPRQTSPAFASRSQGEAWETASAASSTLASDYPESAFHPGNNNSGGPGMLPFPSPMSDSNAMRFNRGRCFSAGAGIPASSFEQHQAVYYDNVPLTGTANRQRCATVSPPGMSRLHEDRPFLFSTDEKERLAIPPLSEPRLRLHSTGGLNTHGPAPPLSEPRLRLHTTGGINTHAMRAFNSSLPPPPNGSGSAFVPIGKSDDQFLPQSPPPQRAKFGRADRTISTGSAASASGHGDLPSSMAEAVLESITSIAGAPIGGKVIASSPFRSTKQEMVGESPFRGMSESSDNTSSAFRMDSLLPESSGSMSLFSSGESRNLFPSENSGERMLLGTHSWGGAEDDTAHSSMGISHDFSNLLNLSNLPALRGRAATEPAWFGGIDPLFVSRIDPEHNGHNGERKAPPRVSSLVDTNAPTNFNAHSQHDTNFEGRFK